MSVVRQAALAAGAALVILAVAWRFATTTAGDGIPSYVPDDPAEVVGTLPQGARALRALWQQSLAQPQPADPDRASALARRHYEEARASGDPRLIGLAQAAIAPWWDDSDPPAPVALMRATILQHGHRFEQALDDLRRVTAREPSLAQGWLSRAAVERVVGDLRSARASCERLRAVSAHPAAAVCIAELDALAGDRSALARVRTIRARAVHAGPAERVWMATVHGEIADHLGESAEAERAFRDALAIADDDYARAALADLLLDAGREREVVALIDPDARSDILMLRRAIALRRLGDARADAVAGELRERYAASARRGDSEHLRELARIALEIDAAPQRALELAARNWASQKEPADAALLLAAADAAGDPAAALAVREHLAAQGVVLAGRRWRR